MNVSLHPDLRRFVEEQAEAGRYDSPDAIINAAVARLKTEKDILADELAEIRAEVAIGLDEADRGEVEDWNPENLKRRVRQRP